VPETQNQARDQGFEQPIGEHDELQFQANTVVNRTLFKLDGLR
jgi:hypothetical protein